MADNETSREDKQLAPSKRKLDKARSLGIPVWDEATLLDFLTAHSA